MNLFVPCSHAIVVSLTACMRVTEVGFSDPSVADASSAAANDTAQYADLQATLDARRIQFLPRGAMNVAAAGHRLFWLEFPAYDPVLYSYDTRTQTRMTYAFSGGGGDSYNFRASDAFILTSPPRTGTFDEYDAAQPDHAVAQATLPLSGSSGLQWWAYAVDGSTAWMVVTERAANALYRWDSGGQPVRVTTLESAGAQVGTFTDFGVSGNTLAFIESGRLWTLDIAANHASWIKTDTQVGNTVSIDPDGITFSDASEPLRFFDLKAGQLRTISQEIAQSPYRINGSFSSGHYVDRDGRFSRYKSWIVYVGNLGVFGYDLVSKAVVPLLLVPLNADPSLTYRRPVVLADGTMFVEGLTGSVGSIGADGPTYSVPLAAVLR